MKLFSSSLNVDRSLIGFAEIFELQIQTEQEIFFHSVLFVSPLFILFYSFYFFHEKREWKSGSFSSCEDWRCRI